MPRCSQKTTKGLRCKGNGVENDGVIMCATHLKHMMPELIPLIPSAPPCIHKSICDLTHEKCCECSDTRPIQKEGYVAYLNTHLADAELVSRHYYYCPSCKDHLTKPPPKATNPDRPKTLEDMPALEIIPVATPLLPVDVAVAVATKDMFDTVIDEMSMIVGTDGIAKYYLRNIKATHDNIISDIKADPNNQKEGLWNFVVDDTLDHILSERLAGMPENRILWSGNDAKLKTLMDRLTEIHYSMMKPTNPDPRDSEIVSLKNEIARLKYKLAECYRFLRN